MPRIRETLEGNHTPATFPDPATNTSTSGTDIVDYSEMKKADLKALAALRDITVTTRMTSAHIIELLEEADDGE